MDQPFKFTPKVILLPFLSVLLLWLVFWAEWKFNFDFARYGVYPRDLIGLRGVIFSPFIHGDIGHLYNNSLPLAVLLAALAYFYREIAYKVIGYGILFSGLGTWLIGRPDFHIGASGLIYVLVSFIFLKGLRTGYYRLTALSLLVVMLYGGMVWYIFPDVEAGISWEGHLAGLVTGTAFAVWFKTPDYREEIRYDWQRPDFDPSTDKFMQRFDKDGNFQNPPPPEPDETPEPPHIVYDFIPKQSSGDTPNQEKQ